MNKFFIPPFLRRRFSVICSVLLMTYVLAGCSTMAYLADASSNPPDFELIRTTSGDQIELYSVEVGAEPRRALLFVSGSGCASLTYYMRSYFSGLKGSWKIYAVQKAGVHSGDIGVICSEAFIDSYNFDLLKERNRIALEEIVRRHGEIASLIGVSEGGQIAAELAQLSPSVCSLVVIGSGGLPFRELARLLDDKRGRSDFARSFAEVDAEPDNKKKSVLGYPFRYWSSFIDRDPAPVYLALKQPILMIMGEKDESVPIEAAKFLEERFMRAQKHNFRLLVVSGANHALKQDGVDRKPEIFGLMSKFITERLQCTSHMPD